jgi:protein arginine N-methyltransferase 1
MYDDTSLQTIEYHRSMLLDKERTGSFLRAILRTVKAGDVVLDMGCGTGILSYFACMSGARRVYAIEQDPIIELAKAICQQNGYQDRVVFVNDWSNNIELPEPVDVIVTETLGNIGFEEGILGWVMDAKERLLAEGGRIIPRSIELVLVPVENSRDYANIESWGQRFYSLDLSPARSLAANHLLWAELSPDSFLSEPASLVCVTLSGIESADIGGEVTFLVKRDGVLHGIGGWFIANLAPGVKITNAPPLKTLSWNQAFLPLERPLAVRAGDHLGVEIQTSSNAAQWQWGVTINGAAGGEATSREVIGSEGSSLAGELLASTNGRSPDYTPTRNEEGDVDLLILQMMDGATPVGEIARQVIARFPTQFTSYERALEYVYDLSDDFGRRNNDAKGGGLTGPDPI